MDNREIRISVPFEVDSVYWDNESQQAVITISGKVEPDTPSLYEGLPPRDANPIPVKGQANLTVDQ